MKEDKHKMTEQSLPFDFFADEPDPVEQSATEPAEADASQAAADKKAVVEQQHLDHTRQVFRQRQQQFL